VLCLLFVRRPDQMAACGLVALVPAAFWASVQAAFRRAEPRDTAAA